MDAIEQLIKLLVKYLFGDTIREDTDIKHECET